MPRRLEIPDSIARRPFTRQQAAEAGLPSHAIREPRFARVFPRVWVSAEHTLTARDRVEAAMLAVGSSIPVSHESRLALMGVTSGPSGPVRFLVDHDLHLAPEGVFVHRTKLMPALDDIGIAPYAAYVCAGFTRRMLDLVVLGDWLLHHGEATRDLIAGMATEERWRPGSGRILRVLPQLDPRARSPRESELRAILVAAGLPAPEANVDLVIAGRWIACVDLLFREWGLVVEYEGRQHRDDDQQYERDIGRYARMRQAHVPYVQVTDLMLRSPRAVVLHVYRALLECGYDGPAPSFGKRWHELFAPPPVERAARGRTS